jgi:hypothetical protein
MLRRRAAVVLAAATLTLAAAGTALAVPIGDFEGGSLDGWDVAPSAPTGKSIASVPGTGQTLGGQPLPPSNTSGTNSLEFIGPQNGFWGPRSRNLVAAPVDRNALATSNRLQWDETMSGVGLSGGNAGFTGFAQSNEVAITLFAPDGPDADTNPDINLFIQKNFTAANGTDTKAHGAQWAGDNGTRTLGWDLTTFTADDPTTVAVDLKTVAQLVTDHPEIVDSHIWMTAQAGNDPNAGDAHFFFDNVQLVPEPATLGLAAMALPAMLRRRRGR